MSKVKLARFASQIMIITILSKVMGFWRDALIAKEFGATYQTDAYMMSLTIPSILFGLFGLAITTTFIPMLTKSLKEKGKGNMYEFANTVMNLITLLAIVIGVLGWMFTPQLVKLIAPGYKGDVYNLTIQLTRLSVINVVFISLNSGYTAILQTLDNFVAPSLVGVVMNVFIIGYLLFVKDTTIMGLTIATIIGNGSQILIQIPWLIKNKYKYSWKINFKDPRLKEMMVLILPVLIGIGINQINTFVDNNVASILPKGSVSVLQYANRLNSLVYGIFATSIITVIYPTLAKYINGTEIKEDFKKYLSKAINNINLIMFPATVGIIVLRTNIINVVFKRGAFDENAVNATAIALLFLAIGTGVLGIRDIYNRAFYAIQDTKTPMKNSAIGVFTNVVLDIALVKVMGIGGLTLATTISIIVSTILLAVDLRKKIGNIDAVAVLKTGGKIFTASVIMGLVVYVININVVKFISGNRGQMVSLMLCAAVGCIVYAIAINLFKVEEYNDIKSHLLGKLKIK
ncbi:murein biosynthesis integral membrane protein MurJ [Clostridium botulinum]|uniref:Probable lipid II flippase MurJ n=1 Tax=Clostridium botulinum TaxID=1491 RepID=A0A9Q1UWM1_CLOBO|nr:murein biosynthesis integral membrane protein MurJ [Clostridium botulinum]AEB75683.1 integral membrane protein MviN [Clostridium botulinum BKT015925]KEI00524.1 virulence factor MviN [Clostridium botulinum C/D str. Sp77]KEI02185.1 virulence factor MviN [Clostridium botulinum D str. 16868]KLU76415.1 virulence factor MviN [Clostridium botulinum V891]KOA72983.1 virulence factor MviN [Clostridium botulinum]